MRRPNHEWTVTEDHRSSHSSPLNTRNPQAQRDVLNVLEVAYSWDSSPVHPSEMWSLARHCSRVCIVKNYNIFAILERPKPNMSIRSKMITESVSGRRTRFAKRSMVSRRALDTQKKHNALCSKDLRRTGDEAVFKCTLQGRTDFVMKHDCALPLGKSNNRYFIEIKRGEDFSEEDSSCPSVNRWECHASNSSADEYE